jgi:hypothetical protein
MSRAAGPRPMPESVPEGQVLIEVADGMQRDEEGRVRYAAYWHEDIRWRGGGTVAGQVSFADERADALRWRERGYTVLYWPSGEEVPPS